LSASGHWGWAVATEHDQYEGAIDPTPWSRAQQRLIAAITARLPAGAVVRSRLGTGLGRSWNLGRSVQRAAPGTFPRLADDTPHDSQRAHRLAVAAHRRLAERWPLQLIVPYGHLITPTLGGHPCAVAADGSRRANGTISWAYVTGTGLANVGRGLGDVRTGPSQLAELAAILHALAAYPDGTCVTLYVDQPILVDLIRRINDAGRARWLLPDTTWMTDHHFGLLANHLFRLQVRPHWVKSHSGHQLHDHADRLARTAAYRHSPKRPR
jgi:ribonuclease HI